MKVKNRQSKNITEAELQVRTKSGKLINRLVEVGKRFNKNYQKHHLEKLCAADVLEIYASEAENLAIIAGDKSKKAEAIEAARQLANPKSDVNHRGRDQYLAKPFFRSMQDVADKARKNGYHHAPSTLTAPRAIQNAPEAMQRLNNASKRIESIEGFLSLRIKRGIFPSAEEQRHLKEAMAERDAASRYIREQVVAS